jgi:hypothetical protein
MLPERAATRPVAGNIPRVGGLRLNGMPIDRNRLTGRPWPAALSRQCGLGTAGTIVRWHDGRSGTGITIIGLTPGGWLQQMPEHSTGTRPRSIHDVTERGNAARRILVLRKHPCGRGSGTPEHLHLPAHASRPAFCPMVLCCTHACTHCRAQGISLHDCRPHPWCARGWPHPRAGCH